MPRTNLRADQWERIEHMLPGKASDPGRTAKDNRLFVEAVLWMARREKGPGSLNFLAANPN